MGITLRGISRYRPRALTLLVLFVLTGLIVLANLSFDIREVNDKNPAYKSDWRQLAAGWPLLWRRHFLILSPGPCFVTVQYYSASRLAMNVLLWLAMLAGPAGACEWLVRRYRLGLRWSLRTMLTAVALVAACCGCFVAACNRADIQDPLIATIKGRGGQVVIERWGPKWLDAIGADRFRRRVVGVEFGTWGFSALNGDDEDDEALFKQVARLPTLRYLCVKVDRLSIGMAAALNYMPELRVLRIEQGWEAGHAGSDSKRISHVCLSHIGKMARLEQLCLARMEIDNKSLGCLAGLANLESLLLEDITSDADLDEPPPLLAHLPRLPRLEALGLPLSIGNDQDIHRLAVLPRLKSLDLRMTWFPMEDLAELRCVPSLEELGFDVTDDDFVAAEQFKSLLELKNLKRLHLESYGSAADGDAALALDDDGEIMVPEPAVAHFRRALNNLRKSNPGITIDSKSFAWPAGPAIPWEEEKTSDFYRNMTSLPTPFGTTIVAIPAEEAASLNW